MCLKRSEHKENRTLIYSHNPDFKGLEFVAFKNEAGGNTFTMSPQKWITATNAKDNISKSGRYGGSTYIHSDIALATQKLKYPIFIEEFLFTETLPVCICPCWL